MTAEGTNSLLSVKQLGHLNGIYNVGWKAFLTNESAMVMFSCHYCLLSASVLLVKYTSCQSQIWILFTIAFKSTTTVTVHMCITIAASY